MTLPKAQIILSYKEFFGTEPPSDTINLISKFSKKHILYEIAALNYRLKPKDEIQIDESFNTQKRELKYFTQTDNLYLKYAGIAYLYYKSESDFGNIFNRQACLYAIEEIVNSDKIQDIEDFEMARIEVWEGILKYLLATNYIITQFKKEENDDFSLEAINPKLIPLNELSIETDQIFTLFRGYCLINYFLHHADYKTIILEYFKDKYDIEPEYFIFRILELYIADSSKDKELNFFYLVQEGHEKLFDALSQREKFKDIYKLLSIRKSPFINDGKNKYLIADNSLLIEKTYSQFINDFWFDKVKDVKDQNGKQRFSIYLYRSAFGYFFEKYLTQLLSNSFENYKYSVLLMFDKLKVNSSKGSVEIADIYLRHDTKILIGQVKSGNIYDDAKFGGNMESLYKNDRAKFFKDFGVDQVIESISKMNNNIQILDLKFPHGHAYKVFPCIIVNDKSLQTPLMANIFNIRFQELIKNIKVEKAHINPLTIIHINDLERLEDSLNHNPKEIWDLLKYNFRNKKFIPPFYNTINQKWKGRRYPERILEIYKELIFKYNKNYNVDN